MTAARRAFVAAAGNALLLTALAALIGGFSFLAIAFASVHAGLECASQQATDRSSREDALLFGLSGLLLLGVYVGAASSPDGLTWVLGSAWAAGIALRVAAMRALGAAFRSATLPTGRWIRTGVFRFLHHPSELGLALCVVAAASAAGSTFAFLLAVCSLALGVFRVRAEEKWRPHDQLLAAH